MTDNYIMTHKQARENRQLAITMGESTYFGNPCPRNHSGVRYVKSNNCKQCTHAFHESNPYKPRGMHTYIATYEGESAKMWAHSYVEAIEHHVKYYRPILNIDKCKHRHTCFYRTVDRQCMSCLQQKRRIAKRNKERANRGRYIPVWLR